MARAIAVRLVRMDIRRAVLGVVMRVAPVTTNVCACCLCHPLFVIVPGISVCWDGYFFCDLLAFFGWVMGGDRRILAMVGLL